MEEEPILFLKEAGKVSAGTLLIPARQILNVTDTTGQKIYEEGTDFILGEERRKIILTDQSRIPVLDEKELIRPPGAPNSYPGCRPEDPNRLHHEGDLFPNLQVRFTYRHDPWAGFVPGNASALLPRTHQKLSRKESFRLVVYGDSISEGFNATGFIKIPPFAPEYGRQIAQELENRFQTSILYRNVSLAGKATAWAVENTDRVLVEKPDLLILAWGMNDASKQVPVGDYLAGLVAMRQAVRRVCPEVEFILVATSQANPQWTFNVPDCYKQYLEGLRTLTGTGTALADLTTMWSELLRRKSYLSLTGNGLNHPNVMTRLSWVQSCTMYCF